MPSQQPPSRRRPVPAPTPTRRPRVAGLRRPEAKPTDEPDANESTQVIPKIPAEPAARQEPAAEPVADQPKPAGKRRPRPTPKPVESTAELPRVETAELPRITDEQRDDVGEPVVARRSRLLLPVVLAVVAVLVGGLAAWFGVQWSNTRGDNANTALTDSATTSEVSGQVTSAVNTVFSYDYTNLAKTRTAVQRLLTGNALCQYNVLYKDLRQQAPSQKLVLTTTVQDKGVELLQGGTARVLLLVQQHDTRATTNQTSDSQSMIAVNAIKQGATWKINSIDTFSGTSPTAGCKS